MRASTAQSVRQSDGNRTVSAQAARCPPLHASALSRCARVRHHVSPDSLRSCPARRPALALHHRAGHRSCDRAVRTHGGSRWRNERRRHAHSPGGQRAGHRWCKRVGRVRRGLQPLAGRSPSRRPGARLRQRQRRQGDAQGRLDRRRPAYASRCPLARRQHGRALCADGRHDLRQWPGRDGRERRAAHPGRDDRNRRCGLGNRDQYLARGSAGSRCSCRLEPRAAAGRPGRVGAGHGRQQRRLRGARDTGSAERRRRTDRIAISVAVGDTDRVSLPIGVSERSAVTNRLAIHHRIAVSVRDTHYDSFAERLGHPRPN